MRVRAETVVLFGMAMLSACRPAEEQKVIVLTPTLPPPAWSGQIEPPPQLPGPTETPSPPPWLPTGRPTPTAIRETPPAKEVEEPSYIWFVGSSTMREFGERLTSYLNRLFPEPQYQVSVTGRGGYQIENLTSEIRDNKLFPSVDRVPVAPEKVKFIVVFAGANDLFADEGTESMIEEIVNLFTLLAEKYVKAKFVYVKPYHLKGAYVSKNPRIDAFNAGFSSAEIIAKVKAKTGREISLSTVDINRDLDNCCVESCWLDDRHVGPKMLEDMADKVKEEIKP